ncbi:hypothetical protein AC579_4602 [Pseudocercospora musae]|uniref:Uncharacterized protein n=1 Tax=Pseudocercospora musae TaxID=113226 RepID=A0A139ITM4_9PEZI|nr:hypothetical protein AC579_4602 [Pseudocercospora musae]
MQTQSAEGLGDWNHSVRVARVADPFAEEIGRFEKRQIVGIFYQPVSETCAQTSWLERGCL